MNKDRYFSHNVSANADPKISAMVAKYGMQGYGLFWLILEHMAKTEKISLPLKSFTFDSLTSTMPGKQDARRSFIKQFIDDCINEFELFTKENETAAFYSSSLRERLELAEETRLKRIKAGEQSAINRGLIKANQHVLNTVETPLEQTSNTLQHVATNKNININRNEKKDLNKRDTAVAVVVQEHLFSESEYFDFEKFKQAVESEMERNESFEAATQNKLDQINIGFYYEAIRNWSTSKNKTSFNWIATAITFIMNDLKIKRPREKSFPNIWVRDYALKLKPLQYNKYVQHLMSLGYKRKQSPSGEYYSKFE